MTRDDAYRSCSATRSGPGTSGRPFRELLEADPEVAERARRATELDELFDLRRGSLAPRATDVLDASGLPPLLASGACPSRRRAGGPRAPQPGQGAGDVRPRRPPADGRLRPHLGLRRGAADADPGQGQVLTGLSVFWFEPHGGHRPQPPALDRRAGRGARPRRWWCAKLEILPVECVVRGYLSGSGWKDYQRDRRGLRHRAAGRPARVRPPAGADLHARHEGRARASTTRTSTSTARPRSSATARLMEELRRLSLALYARGGRARASATGIILADTKFEFGRDPTASIVLADEVLTPDSSRFWPADRYEPGGSPAVVRQAVRARLARRSRAGTTRRPARSCPPRSSQDTRAKYVEAYERIAGEPFERLARRSAEGARPDQAEGGHPRPAGPGGRAGAAGARLRRRRRACTSAG